MVRLKHLKAYERNSCPDHIVHEVDNLMDKMCKALWPILDGADLNIILAAFNRLHASIIVALISEKEGELESATLCEVKGLIGNIEDISGKKVLKNDH
jgi:hypothetical protein